MHRWVVRWLISPKRCRPGRPLHQSRLMVSLSGWEHVSALSLVYTSFPPSRGAAIIASSLRQNDYAVSCCRTASSLHSVRQVYFYACLKPHAEQDSPAISPEAATINSASACRNADRTFSSSESESFEGWYGGSKSMGLRLCLFRILRMS